MSNSWGIEESKILARTINTIQGNINSQNSRSQNTNGRQRI